MENTGDSKRINTKVRGTIGGPGGKKYLIVDVDDLRLIVPTRKAPQTIIGLLGALREKRGPQGA